MKSRIAFFVSIIGGMVLSGPIFAVNVTDRQLPVESSLSQNNHLQTSISPSRMTQQENFSADSTGDSMRKEDSPQQIDAKKLEVELRKLLLLSCPR
jgi:hypothetical protein